MLAYWERLPGAVRYVLPRALALAVSWLLVTAAVFVLLFRANDPVDSLLGLSATPEQRAAVRHELGLDKPAIEQYGDWLGDMFRGDFGRDVYYQSTVAIQLKQRIEPTVELLVVATVLGTAAGAGIDAARRRRWPWLADVSSSLLFAVPVFVVSVFVIVVPADKWGFVLPLGRHSPFYRDPLGDLKQVGIAGAVVAMVVAVSVASQLRRVRAGPRRVFASPGAIALAGVVALPIAVSADIIVEMVFTIPGLGQYLYTSMAFHDLFAVRSLVALIAVPALIIWLAPPRRPRPADNARGRGAARFNSNYTPIMVAAALLGLFVVAGIIGPWIAPYGQNDYTSGLPNAGISAHHWLGTDRIGRDEFSRMLFASRRTLKFTAAVLFFGFVPGALAGVAIGRYRRRLMPFVPEFNTLARALPWLVVLLVVFVARPASMQAAAAVLALGAFGAGLTLASVVPADQPLDRRIFVHGVLPAAASRTLGVAALAVLAHATLGFLGIDPEPGASFGRDLATARNSFPIQYELMLVISVWLGVILLACYLGREALRTVIEMPARRE